MSCIEVKDVFDELNAENRRLFNQLLFAKKCLNVLIKFKTHLNYIFNEFKTNFSSKDLQIFEDLSNEYKEVFGEKDWNLIDIKSERNEEIIAEKDESIDRQSDHLLDSFGEMTAKTIHKNKKQFVCDFIGCGKQYKSKEGLRLHRRLHTSDGKPFVCDIDSCDYRTRSKDNIMGHKNRHNGLKPYECGYDSCGQQFYTYLKYKYHKRVHILNKSSNKELFKCDSSECDYKTKSKNLFINHKNRHKGVKPYECRYDSCGKRFISNETLKDHIKYGHQLAQKKYRCDFIGCDYQTLKQMYLINHKNRHSGLKPFQCSYDTCAKCFISERSLNDHIQLMHKTTEKLFECTECEKRFKNKHYLSNHLRKHMNSYKDIPKPFACDHPNCDYRARHSFSLEIHMKSHSDERPFSCESEGCLKSFKSKYSLSEHMKTHSTSKSVFKCPFDGCDKSYNRKSSLKKHLISHSDNQLTCDWPGCEFTTKLKQNLREHQLVHKSDSNFICDWPQCDKRFKRRQYLEQHLRVHKSDKKFACHWPGCQYRCVESGNLRKHFRVHQKNS